MKKYLVIVLCLTATVLGINKKYIQPQVNTVGLVTRYKLWAGLMASGKVFDYSFNSNQGTVTNATSAYPGFSFNGSDTDIDCGNGSTVQITGNLTLNAWINTSATGSIQYIISKDDASNRCYYLQLLATDNPRFCVFVSNVSKVADGANTVNNGKWRMITGTYDGSASVGSGTYVRTYVDGVLVKTSAEVTGAIDNDTENIFIGKQGNSSNYFNGKIDEPMIFNRALSATEIKSLFEITRWRYQK